MRNDDTLTAWRLDRLGRGVGLETRAGQGANLDTTTANGRMVFGILAAIAEFERELIIECTRAGRALARDRGRPFKMTAAKPRLAQAAMRQPGTKVGQLCAELGVSRQTLYRHADPRGGLRPDGGKLLHARKRVVTAGLLSSPQQSAAALSP